MRVMLFALLCASLMLQGCLLLAVGAGAGAGAGTLAYVRGELQTTSSPNMPTRIFWTKARLGGSASSLRLATRPVCPPADDVPTETGIA